MYFCFSPPFQISHFLMTHDVHSSCLPSSYSVLAHSSTTARLVCPGPLLYHCSASLSWPTLHRVPLLNHCSASLSWPILDHVPPFLNHCSASLACCQDPLPPLVRPERSKVKGQAADHCRTYRLFDHSI